jgi:hypothetical protein
MVMLFEREERSEAMKLIRTILKKTFLWDYERGSWQYDILCGLILVFIFFGPNQVFHSADGVNSAPLVISRNDVGELAPEQAEQIISDYISAKFNRKVKATNIEPMFNETGSLTGYLVKEIKQ